MKKIVIICALIFGFVVATHPFSNIQVSKKASITEFKGLNGKDSRKNYNTVVDRKYCYCQIKCVKNWNNKTSSKLYTNSGQCERSCDDYCIQFANDVCDGASEGGMKDYTAICN